MAITAKGSYTGLLGYSLKKEFLGEGLNYLEIENYNYEIIITDFANTSDLSSFIEGELLAKFNEFSGNVNATTFQIPANENLPENQINTAKYLSTIEVRKTPTSLLVDNPELWDLKYNNGLYTVFKNYPNNIDGLSESFAFNENDDGTRDFTHSMSFSLRTGDKTIAQAIATTILGNDYQLTGYGVNVFEGALKTYGNEANSKNYYSETYDLARNAFSFEKRKNILPTALSAYSSEYNHSLNMNEQGIITVNETVSVRGVQTFNQAVNGLNTELAGVYTRCADFFNAFAATIGGAVDPLRPIDLTKRITYNKPGIEASATLEFSNDTNLKTYLIEQSVLNIDMETNSVVTMNDSYNFTLTGQIYPNMDSVLMGGKNISQIISDAKTNSPAKCNTAYSAYGFDDTNRSLVLLDWSAKTANRGRNHSLSVKYSNDPDYSINSINLLGGGFVSGFTMVSSDVSNNIPEEQFNEYIIVNRPTKTSVLSPSYQSSVGTVGVTLKAQIERPAANLLNSPYKPTSEIQALYDLARTTALKEFLNTPFFALSYHLSNLSYGYNNKNELSLSLELSYVNKKRNN